MAGEKILVTDDERDINNLVSSYLRKEGFTVFQAFNGSETLAVIEKEDPDFVVLDIMLPDIDGTALCLEIRKKSDAGILFLSCKAEEMDKIIALSAGGDDYMTKPFMPGEMVARIKAYLRRHQSSEIVKAQGEEVYSYGDLVLNNTTREVWLSGEEIKLTAKEFDILRLFVQNPRRIFTADQLFELVWQTDSLEGDSRTVMVYISTLRKKIEPEPEGSKYIINIRGVGYKFNHHLINEGANHGKTN